MTTFDEIYNKYHEEIYLFILNLSRDPHIAEEITQETFFKALQNIKHFKGNCKVSVWLCQIAKNTYFTHYSKEKRFEGELVDKHLPTDSSLEESLSSKEEAFKVHKVLHNLDEPYKEVFTLRVFGELSYAQIGQLFEKTESWSRVTFYRAKQKIRDLLDETPYHIHSKE